MKREKRNKCENETAQTFAGENVNKREDEKTFEETAGIEGEVWIPYDADLNNYNNNNNNDNNNIYNNKHIPHDEWTKSANGAW